MKNFLYHFWQLPQHLVAWLILATCATSYITTYKGARVYGYNLKRSCSLGGYIFLSRAQNGSHDPGAVTAHEWGHSRQSLLFGWSYLLVIGLPSAMNIFEGVRYYSRFPEKWANKLGGVEAVSTGPRSCDYKLQFLK